MSATRMVAYRGFRLEHDGVLGCWWVLEPGSGEAWGFGESLDSAKNVADRILTKKER